MRGLRLQLGALSLAAAFGLACGGGTSSGSASVTGTVDSVAMHPHSAVYAYDSRYSNLFMKITESADPCGDLKSGHLRPSDVVLDLSVGDFAASNVPAGTYTYNVVGDQIVTGAEFTQLDDHCGTVVDEQIVQGTITVQNTVDSTHQDLEASFDLVMNGSENHLTGNLVAVYCDADLATVPAPTCTP